MGGHARTCEVGKKRPKKFLGSFWQVLWLCLLRVISGIFLKKSFLEFLGSFLRIFWKLLLMSIEKYLQNSFTVALCDFLGSVSLNHDMIFLMIFQ